MYVRVHELSLNWFVATSGVILIILMTPSCRCCPWPRRLSSLSCSLDRGGLRLWLRCHKVKRRPLFLPDSLPLLLLGLHAVGANLSLPGLCEHSFSRIGDFRMLQLFAKKLRSSKMGGGFALFSVFFIQKCHSHLHFRGVALLWEVLLTFKGPHKLFMKKVFHEGDFAFVLFYSYRENTNFYYFAISASGKPYLRCRCTGDKLVAGANQYCIFS
jgi:hypothetical protein